MILVAMQPTYLPWLGYFDLMDQADVFVLLDNVQFEHRSWQHRNRLRSPSGLVWLTVPVKTSGRRGQMIYDVEIDFSQGFPRRHIRAVELYYRRARYFDRYYPTFRELLLQAGPRLVELNIKLMDWIARELGIQQMVVRGSERPVNGKRSTLLVELCRDLGTPKYLSPVGSYGYIRHEHASFAQAGIRVLFHNYVHPTYRQAFVPFVPYCSTLDLLMNHGEEAVTILRSGRRNPLEIHEVESM